MTEVVNIRAEKEDLRQAIRRWDLSVPLMRHETWEVVEAAILALDNAAYDRAYKQAREREDVEERPTGFQGARDRVHAVIEQWYKAPGPEQARAWRAVEDVLWAFDEMAFGRGFEQNRDVVERLNRDLEDERAHREHVEIELTELQRQFDERGRERDQSRAERDAAWKAAARLREELSESRTLRCQDKRQLELAEQQRRRWEDDAVRLLRERDEERRRTTVMTLANDDKRQELRRLKQDLEFTEHRREQAEKEIERLQAELADAQSDLGIRDRDSDDYADDAIRLREELAEANRCISNLRQTVLARVEVSRGPEADPLRKERDEARVALTGERRAVAWALKGRDAARAERDGFRGELELLHERMSKERIRLRKALETLVDQYHDRLCGRAASSSHSREDCLARPSAVREAEKALAGESEMPHFPGKIDNVVVVNTALSPKEVEEVLSDMTLFDDRKPKEQPEIEAVLMIGSELACADGCGAVVQRGQCAYRSMECGADEPLYASEACARKAARPKARTHPPYAAYTRFLRRAEEEERRQRCEVNREAAGYPYSKPPAPPKMKAVYECSSTNHYGFDIICGWTGSSRDLSPKGRCPRCWHEVRIVEKLP